MALSAGDRDLILRTLRDCPIPQIDKSVLIEQLGPIFGLTSDDKRSAYDHIVAKR